MDHILVTRHDDKPIPDRLHQTVRYPADLELSNRAGTLTHIGLPVSPLERPCFAPTDMMIVGSNGDVLLCCEDAKRDAVMGNIVENSLEDVWFSERFVEMRRKLQRGERRDAAPMCSNCSNEEYFARGEAFWPDPFKDDTGWVERPIPGQAAAAATPAIAEDSPAQQRAS